MTDSSASYVSCFFRCEVGETRSGAGDCIACAAGKFKAESGDAECTACAANSNSLAGSTAATACTCNAGFLGPDGGPCQPNTTATTTPIITTTPAPQEVVVTAVMYFGISPAKIVEREAEFEGAIAEASGVSRSPSPPLPSPPLSCPTTFLGLLLLDRNVCALMRVRTLT